MSATRVPDVREQLPVRVVRRHVHAGAVHRRVFPAQAQRRVYRESGEARRHLAVGAGARWLLLCPVHVRGRGAPRPAAVCATARVLPGDACRQQRRHVGDTHHPDSAHHRLQHPDHVRRVHVLQAGEARRRTADPEVGLQPARRRILPAEPTRPERATARVHFRQPDVAHARHTHAAHRVDRVPRVQPPASRGADVHDREEDRRPEIPAEHGVDHVAQTVPDRVLHQLRRQRVPL